MDAERHERVAEAPAEFDGDGSAARLEADAEREQRVTALELFFDLVFVFAITQVTGYVDHDPTWTRFVEGLAILAALWFGWSCYAWLGNTAGTDEGLVRVILLAAMGAMVIVSLAVPKAFGAAGLQFGIAYFVVRVLHIGYYAALVRGRHDESLAGAVVRLGSTMIPAAGVLIVAGALHGAPRAVCWAIALTIDYGGLIVLGVEGWRVQAAHFAERHGAVIIIALGESVLALGVEARSGVSLSGAVIAGALLGMTAIAALWWAYFDMVAIVAERRFSSAMAHSRVLIARDSYTFLHLFMVGGIVVFAIGVEQTLAHHGAHLATVPAVALCGGLALYLLALSGFKKRNLGTFNRPRLVAAVLLLALIPAATSALPALAALGVAAAITCGLVGYEFWRYADYRGRVRSAMRT